MLYKLKQKNFASSPAVRSQWTTPDQTGNILFWYTSRCTLTVKSYTEVIDQQGGSIYIWHHLTSSSSLKWVRWDFKRQSMTHQSMAGVILLSIFVNLKLRRSPNSGHFLSFGMFPQWYPMIYPRIYPIENLRKYIPCLEGLITELPLVFEPPPFDTLW